MGAMIFSERTAWDLCESEFARRIAEQRARAGFADLTMSNPTHCGFVYSEDLLAPLSQPEAAVYDPVPLGATVAREAVATYYRDHGADLPLAHLCLTTGTSEACSFLFRLLCDPGDEVLVARPSYPLFDFIARLDGVVLREYPLLCDPGATHSGEAWSIDMDALESAIGPRTRAILLVHPNNPTGNYVSGSERAALDALCAERGLALIVDEVFLDYALGPQTPRSFASSPGPALCFVLSGISKVCGLPQMKASWIAALGPEALVLSAMQRLEMIADTFLSMNAPVQHALGPWLRSRARIQTQIRERVLANLSTLDARIEGTSASRYAIEAGWTAVLRVPRTVDGAPFADAALDRSVLVQPGEFYGLPEGRCVLSLLTPASIWSEGLARLPID
jgi:alanine-synthesizing transaminase